MHRQVDPRPDGRVLRQDLGTTRGRGFPYVPLYLSTALHYGAFAGPPRETHPPGRTDTHGFLEWDLCERAYSKWRDVRSAARGRAHCTPVLWHAVDVYALETRHLSLALVLRAGDIGSWINHVALLELICY